MTAVRKSTMNIRNRRVDDSKKNTKGPLLILNVLFLICFTIYQIILSTSNGGKEAITSTYRSFLKGGSSGVDKEKVEGNSMEEDHLDVRMTMMLKEQEQIPEIDEISPIMIQANPLPKEIEVKFEEDVFRIGEKDNIDAAGTELSPYIFDTNPLPKEIEVKFEEGVFRIGEKDNIDAAGTELSPYIFDTRHQMFHNYFKGKSGKVLEEMLMAHAYIFHQNATYGGCCGSLSLKMTAHEDLMDALGLRDVLRFKCPRDFHTEERVRRSVIPRDHYMAEDTRIWTPEYVDYLRSLVTYPPKKHKDYTIVVHMLRGNSSPCKEKSRGFHSYLPNLHYQILIDKYMKPGARVIIYTSAKSFEDLTEFRDRGYEVNVDTSLKETWKEFVTADIMIMSRSDFSMVPAMVAKGTVIYTPFWHRSLRRWQRASKAIMAETEEETIRLQETKCVFSIG